MDEQEWEEWRGLPETEEFFTVCLAKARQRLMEQWADGVFTYETKDGTDQANARALGRTQALADLIDSEYEDFFEPSVK
jgi:hypothetical protein